MKKLFFALLGLFLLTAPAVFGASSCQHKVQNAFYLLDNNKTEELRALLQASPDLVHAHNNNGNTLLHEAAKLSDIAAIKLLFDHGADSNTKNDFNSSPFYEALKKANQDKNEIFIQLFLDRNPEVNIQDSQGRNALHLAIEYASQVIIEQILQKGAAVNAQDIIGNTPLHYAAIKDRKEIYQLLLDQPSINILLKNNTRQTAADILQTEQQMTIGLQFSAVANGDIKYIEQLLKSGIDINVQNPCGRTLLHMALWFNQEHIAKFLLRNGADVNSADLRGRNALFYALESDNITLINLVLQSGADVNKQDQDNNTALHNAVDKQDYNLVQLLLNRPDINLTLKNKNNQTALQLAQDCINSDQEIIDLLHEKTQEKH